VDYSFFSSFLIAHPQGDCGFVRERKIQRQHHPGAAARRDRDAVGRKKRPAEIPKPEQVPVTFEDDVSREETITHDGNGRAGTGPNIQAADLRQRPEGDLAAVGDGEKFSTVGLLGGTAGDRPAVGPRRAASSDGDYRNDGCDGEHADEAKSVAQRPDTLPGR
jgi:hypothetical protein